MYSKKQKSSPVSVLYDEVAEEDTQIVRNERNGGCRYSQTQNQNHHPSRLIYQQLQETYK